MVGKNNLKKKLEQDAQRIPHYGLRKLSIGITSVLLSTTLYFGTTSTAHAADHSAATNADTTELTDSQNNLNSSTASLRSTATASNQTTTTASTDSETNNTSTVATLSPQSDNDQASSLTASLNDGTQMTITRNTIGATGDTTPITVTVSYVNYHNGDQYKVALPGGEAYTVTDPSNQKLTVSGTSNVSSQAADGGYTITNTFTQDATGSNGVVQTFTLTPKNNYAAFSMLPMTEIGDVLKHIVLTKVAADGTTSSTSLAITQTITPQMAPSFGRTKPQSSAKLLFPNTDYTYELKIGETSGVATGNDYGSDLINSAVNTSTTITIPVPAGFTLNSAQTATVNSFTDGTTITQPGGSGTNIIITVPKGAGRQAYQGNGHGYQLVGSYQIEQPKEDLTVTAADKITIDQTVTKADGSTYHIVKQVGPWTDQIKGANSEAIIPKVVISGLTYASSQQIPMNSEANKPVLYFGFSNPTSANLTNLALTMTIADGLNVNRIVTPIDNVNLAGTTEYAYTATLSDGSTKAGTVKAGEALILDNDLYFTKIIFQPNLVAAGATTDLSHYPNANQMVAFLLYGTVAPKKSDGTIIKDGTELDSSIQSVVQYTTNDGTVHTETSTVNANQTVSQETASEGTFAYQSQTQPGFPNPQRSGYLSVSTNGNSSVTSHSIFEPVFYYVLPAETFYDDSGLQGGNGSVAPIVTTFNANGREVIKIDYTGTGYNFDTSKGANNLIWIMNSPLAMKSSDWSIYVYSPTTKLLNTKATDDSNYQTSYTDGQSDNVYLLGKGIWNISAASATGTPTQAKGNQNAVYVVNGSSDDKGNGELSFQFRIYNSQDKALTNAVSVINLVDSSSTTESAFHLSGPVSVANSNVKVLYSTSQLTNSGTAQGTQPDLTNFVSADQVSDWSKIQSVALVLGTISAHDGSDIFTLNGTDLTIAQDAGKKMGLHTYLFTDELSPVTASIERNANVTINGSSTVTAGLVDVDGNPVSAVDLSDLTKTYKDNVDTMNQSDFALTSKDRDAINAYLATLNQIDDGYVYSLSPDITIKNGQRTWATNAPNNTAAFGNTVQYYFDSDVVQYHIVRQLQKHTLSYSIVDQTTGKTLVTKTTLGTGTPRDTTSAEKALYQQAVENYTKLGYVVVTQPTIPGKFGKKDQELKVVLTHGVATITPDTAADDVPANSAVQPSDLSKHVGLQIQYQNSDQTPFTGSIPTNATNQRVTLTGTAYVDRVTGELTNAPVKDANGNAVVDQNNTATPTITWTSATTAAVTSPNENGYTALTNEIPAITVTVGNHESDLNDSNSTNVTITKDSQNSTIKRTVKYIPKLQRITYTVHDASTGDNLTNKQFLGKGESNSSTSGLTDDYQSIIKSYQDQGYIVTAESLPTNFDSDDQTDQNVVITLTHPVKRISGTDSNIPANSTVKANDLKKTATLTVNFVNSDGTSFKGTQPDNARQSINLIGTTYIDLITGQPTNAPVKDAKGNDIVDSNNTATPTITWTSATTTAVTSPSETGYHPATSQINPISVTVDNDATKDSGLTSGDQVVLGKDTQNAEITRTVTYAKDPTAQVTYLDQDRNNQEIPDTGSGLLTGIAGQTISYSTKDTLARLKQHGYVLVTNGFDPDGNAPVYDSDDTDTHQYTVVLKHATTTVSPDQPKSTTDPLPDNPSQNYPSGVDESDLNKTITRTIVLHNPNGTITKVPQIVHLTRTATVDEVTGDVTYSGWSTGEWPAYQVPTINGSTASQTVVAPVEVGIDTADTTVDVYYTAIPKPTTNANQPGTSTGTHSSQPQQKSQQLPQTGNRSDNNALIGLGIASVLGMFGLLGNQRRKDQ